SRLSMIRFVPTLLKYWGRINLYNLSGLAELDSETAESYCLKRVTREAYDRLLNPLTRAMFGHDGNEISIVEMLWMIKTYAIAGAVGFQGGMNSFTSALAQGQTILAGHDVRRVEETGSGVAVMEQTPNGEVKLEADYCAIASDGKDMQRIYGHALTAPQNHFLDKLDYNPLSMVFFKFNIKPAGVGAIVEIPRFEDPDLAALAWYDLWGQTKAPPGESALIVLGMNSWQYAMYEKPIEVRIADARRYVEKYYPQLVPHIVSADVTPWPRGTTVGRVGNYRRLKGFVDDIRPKSRVQYGGDYFAQSSIGTAAATGEDLARRMRRAVV
ncbi:MAG: FAD-dependent oxidoreductase, partial [Steroidobacteraceae bacterium]